MKRQRCNVLVDMSTTDLKEYIAGQSNLISVASENLQEAKDELRERLLNNPDLTIPERFGIWLRYGGPKKDYDRIEVVSKSGRDLFDADEPPLYIQKYGTYTIQDIATSINRPIVQYDSHTEQDIWNWMEKLMKLEFKSMTYDW